MLADQDIHKMERDSPIVRSPSYMTNKYNLMNARATSNELTSEVCTRHGNLLTQTKVAVKRMMEDAATKKIIYFNSSTVTELCVAIDYCIINGLPRRIIGIFEESLSMGLLKKIAKDCEAASFILHRISSFCDPSVPQNGRSSKDNDAGHKSQNSISLPNSFTGLFNKPQQSTVKHLWIKLAILEKKLISIVEHLMEQHQLYYHDDSIMACCLSSSLFLELIVGPCFLDLSVVKPSEHFWNDPDASELIDRHLIHSVNSGWPTIADSHMHRSGLHADWNQKHRPFLKMQHNTSPLDIQVSSTHNNTSALGSNVVAKEYVESLHQNLKHVLLYGKNNVVVQPKEDLDEMQGYLSLHAIAGDKLRLNWTPNQLMNYKLSQHSEDMTDSDATTSLFKEHSDSTLSSEYKFLQWDSALSIKIENIVYLHCHNDETRGGKITMVSQDGIQHPPFHFPPGGHLLQFIICLENGLSPVGRLDPPLLQRNDAEKSFPKRYRHYSHDSSIPSDTSEQSTTSLGRSLLNNLNRSLRRKKDVLIEDHGRWNFEDIRSVNCSNSDLIFKIVYPIKAQLGLILESTIRTRQSRSTDITGTDTMCKDGQAYCHWTSEDSINDSNNTTSSIHILCSVMKQRILSRAFYGWLQHYRNIRTVRTKFNNLVQPGSVQSDVPRDASEGLTFRIWDEYKLSKDITEDEIYRLIYFGGCDESIRYEVWPRMLGHYSWTDFDTSKTDITTELHYEKTLSQWKALEVIISQRDNDNVASLVGSTEVLTPSGEGDNLSSCRVNKSNCDLSPSVGFYSSENSVDIASSPSKHDLAFKDEEVVFMEDNMHRIDKDVDRCDRNHPYFSSHGKDRLKGKLNLRKLRNIMITWVWEHVDLGYVQGMCDLLAPLLVVLDNESLTHACFTKLMETMFNNFPQMGSRMDENLSMMVLLLQIIDRDLYDHMCPDGEVTSLYVSYRWLLLDFKREFCYADVFCVWETIWSARHVASNHFNLFLALSLLQYYRDIILDNNMEYTDVIKFYNEMAEKHQIRKVLFIARGLIESIREILQSR